MKKNNPMKHETPVQKQAQKIIEEHRKKLSEHRKHDPHYDKREHLKTSGWGKEVAEHKYPHPKNTALKAKIGR
jgi:hypothetical protein